MPVILIGAIGGMLRTGIVGLFVGAVVMSVGYSMFVAWMRLQTADDSEAADGEAPGGAPETAS